MLCNSECNSTINIFLMPVQQLRPTVARISDFIESLFSVLSPDILITQSEMLLFYGNSFEQHGRYRNRIITECLLPGFFFIDNLLKSKCLFLSSEDKQRTSMVHCTLGMIHNDRQEPEGNFSLLYQRSYNQGTVVPNLVKSEL